MKIVLPTSAHDAGMLPLLVDVILKHGSLDAHDLLLVATPDATAGAFEQAARLRTICPRVEVVTMDTNPDGGWPQAPNMQWFWTVEYLHRSGHRNAFFWMETDCIPLIPQWADRLATAYQHGGNPFFGTVVESPHRDAQGKIITVGGDTMLMGCAIYPPGMLNDEVIKPLIIDLAKRPPHHPLEPWDVYLRWVFKIRGIAASNLIADLWNTQNYQRGPYGIECCPAPTKFEGRARGGVIPAEAVLAHGCKDGSLQKLILEVLPPSKPQVSASSGAAQSGANDVGSHPVAPADSPPRSNAGAVHGSGQLSGPKGEAGTAGVRGSVGDPGPTREAILSILIAGKMQVQEMSAKFGLTKEAFKEKLVELGFTAGGGWVKDARAEGWNDI